MPDEPNLQEVLDAIDELKGMLGNTLDAVIAIKKSLAELQRVVFDLRDQMDRENPL